MEDLIVGWAYDTIYILTCFLVGFLIALVKRKFSTEKILQAKAKAEEAKTLLDNKEKLARKAIEYTEQVAYKLSIQEELKLNHAITWMIKAAGKSGIKLSYEECEGFIEAALRAVKDKFGEEWGKNIA
jgi:hypothetical protein